MCVSALRLYFWILLHGLSTLCPCDTLRRSLCSHCISSSETIEREKSYKTGLRVDWNLSGRGICREGSLPSRQETAKAPGLLLPVLASLVTVTIKGKGDEESHHARPGVPNNWKEEGIIEGFLPDAHAMHRDGIFPTDVATFPGRTWLVCNQIKSSAVNHSMERSQYHLRGQWLSKEENQCMSGQRKGKARLLELEDTAASIWILRWMYEVSFFEFALVLAPSLLFLFNCVVQLSDFKYLLL